MPIPWLPVGPSCTDRNHSDVIEFIGRDFQLVENEVSNIFESYVQSSRDSVEAISKYAQARATYDYDYFVARRIQLLLEILDNPQYGDAKTSASFAAVRKITLKPGENVTIASVYGKAAHIDDVAVPRDRPIATAVGFINPRDGLLVAHSSKGLERHPGDPRVVGRDVDVTVVDRRSVQ